MPQWSTTNTATVAPAVDASTHSEPSAHRRWTRRVWTRSARTSTRRRAGTEDGGVARVGAGFAISSSGRTSGRGRIGLPTVPEPTMGSSAVSALEAVI